MADASLKHWSQMDDAELAEYRATIPVHCGACGATFPGDSSALRNGICRDCRRRPYQLRAKYERQRDALAAIMRTNDLAMAQTIARRTLDA